MSEGEQMVYIKAYGPQWKSSWWWRSHLRFICRMFGHKWNGPAHISCRRCGGRVLGQMVALSRLDGFGLGIRADAIRQRIAELEDEHNDRS